MVFGTAAKAVPEHERKLIFSLTNDSHTHAVRGSVYCRGSRAKLRENACTGSSKRNELSLVREVLRLPYVERR